MLPSVFIYSNTGKLFLFIFALIGHSSSTKISKREAPPETKYDVMDLNELDDSWYQLETFSEYYPEYSSDTQSSVIDDDTLDRSEMETPIPLPPAPAPAAPVEYRPTPAPVSKCRHLNPLTDLVVHPDSHSQCGDGLPGWSTNDQCQCQYFVKDKDANHCPITYYSLCTFIRQQHTVGGQQPVYDQAPVGASAGGYYL